MSGQGNGDAPACIPGAPGINQVYIDQDLGSPVRVKRSGIAFDVILDPVVGAPVSPMASPMAPKRASAQFEKFDLSEAPLTAEQINEKLAAAEARRESLINEQRNRCVEHNVVKVAKAREHRTLVERQMSEDLKEAIDKDLEDAQARVADLREAQLEKLKKEEMRREEIIHRQNEEFEERVRKLDAKYTDQAGSRNRVLSEIVDKLKEHNDRVRMIREDMLANGKPAVDGPHGSNGGHQEWINANNERDEYVRGARDRITHGKFELDEESNGRHE